ncbi:hypothetical protein [Streptomyces sp. NPDC052042]|uniref:hypothetical protein n=1 Tax=Streptomyces sp. NPDC052042 TaxID=3365683 RepID=UPI0037CCF883
MAAARLVADQQSGLLLQLAPEGFVQELAVLDPAAGQRPAHLAGWLAEYGILALVVHDFASQSYADVVHRRTTGHGPATLLWCGDFDASRADIARDWVRRNEDCWGEACRVLLTPEQIVE